MKKFEIIELLHEKWKTYFGYQEYLNTSLKKIQFYFWKHLFRTSEHKNWNKSHHSIQPSSRAKKIIEQSSHTWYISQNSLLTQSYNQIDSTDEQSKHCSLWAFFRQLNQPNATFFQSISNRNLNSVSIRMKNNFTEKLLRWHLTIWNKCIAINFEFSSIPCIFAPRNLHQKFDLFL